MRADASQSGDLVELLYGDTCKSAFLHDLPPGVEPDDIRQEVAERLLRRPDYNLQPALIWEMARNVKTDLWRSAHFRRRRNAVLEAVDRRREVLPWISDDELCAQVLDELALGHVELTASNVSAILGLISGGPRTQTKDKERQQRHRLLKRVRQQRIALFDPYLHSFWLTPSLKVGERLTDISGHNYAETAYLSEALACRLVLVHMDVFFRARPNIPATSRHQFDGTLVAFSMHHAEAANAWGHRAFPPWFHAGTIWDLATNAFFRGLLRANVARSSTLDLYEHAYHGFTPECLDFYYTMVATPPFLFTGIGDQTSAERLVTLGVDLFQSYQRPDLVYRFQNDTADLSGYPPAFNPPDWYPPFFQHGVDPIFPPGNEHASA